MIDIFCQINTNLQNQVIEETRNFYLLHDGYPIMEGHLLIIPKKHTRCCLEIGKSLKEEFFRLKNKVKDFLLLNYNSVIFFEHGVAAQTVSHAHLHALPTKTSILNTLKERFQLMEKPVAPYLFYQEGTESYYFYPNRKILPAYLTMKYVKIFNRPQNGIKRSKDLKKWLLIVREKFGK